MSIQQSVNQSLGILGALYTQTPMYEAKKEAAALKTQSHQIISNIKNLEEQKKQINDMERRGFDETEKITALNKAQTANFEKLAEINPKLWTQTAETFRQYDMIEEQGTAKAAQSLSQAIDKNMAQKDRVADFYNSLKANSFVHAVQTDVDKIPKNLGKPSKEVKDGKSIK